VHRRV